MKPRNGNSNERKLRLIAFPLAMLAFCLITVKAEFACDGVVEMRYGFPLFWIAPDTALSLAKNLSWPALAFDFAFYLGISAWLVKRNFAWRIFGRQPVMISICLWLAAIIVAAFYVFTLGRVVYLENSVWQPPCAVWKSYAPHFGLPF